MTVGELAGGMLSDERIAHGVVVIAIESVLADLPVDREGKRDPVPWGFLLSAASLLCKIQVERAQEAALRIAQGCLASPDAGDAERTAASVLLERMGNRRALRLATKRGLVKPDAWAASPVPLKLDVIRRRLELTIPVQDGVRLHANPFQRHFWTAAATHRWVSVSAPTSAGKSFIVRNWLAQRAGISAAFRAAYVVPTRALIDEVARELQKDLQGDVGVHTLPWDADIDTAPKEIYVMTQERLHLLLGREPSLIFDVLFVDEAHKFGDDARGVLLEQVVDDCSRRDPRTQVLMASPLTSNPGVLLDGAPRDLERMPLAIQGVTVTVNQNLLWADQIPRKPREWRLQLIENGTPHSVGRFELLHTPETPTKRLPLVAVALGGLRPGTVVYVSLPSDAEKVALQIREALGEAAAVDDPQIEALRDLVRRTIHSKYALAACLDRGVAFHYGSMPQLVRQEIERLFREESLRYLVCTSTLLEGVNLPCRLLVLRTLNKGSGNPMTPGDFWNLAGRAGRWGKEFQGNIVCVDASRKEVWPDPPRRRQLQKITRAADPNLQNPGALLDYIAAGAPASAARDAPLLEAVFGLVAARALTAGTVRGLPAIVDDDVERIDAAVGEALEAVELPTDMLLRHAGVSPPAMMRLLTYFRSVANWRVLLLPTAGAMESAGEYATALGVCHDVLGTDFGIDKRQFQLGLLITEWMRGRPLAVIIESRLRWMRRNNRKFTLATEIRNVMRDVETVARFQAPKYLGCYFDVLSFHLQSLGQADLAEELPDIAMMLELGVSRATELSLMTLGISRTSAVALAEYIIEGTLTRDQVIDWISQRDLDAYPLPELVREEIKRAVAAPDDTNAP
jgi:hypothetical protein